jgi:uncharacterized caspase-like protein
MTAIHKSRTAAIAADARERVIRMFWLLLPLLAAAAILASAANATTEPQRRIALVMGNSAYQYAPHLPNPGNDAEAMAATLQRLGFEVTKGIDLDRAETEMIIRQFSKTLPGADVALLFYAGHGIQYQGINYLIPVDAELKDETDLTFEATQLDLVMRLMEREPRVSLIFLDACRDNPFAQQLARSMGATRSAAIGRGLAIVDAVAGSFVAYATDPNQVALDGDGSHSPFTAALLSHIETPGLSISDMMIEVRNDVLRATQNKQRPREDNALTDKFYFMPAAAVATVETAEPAASGNSGSVQAVDKEVVFWQSIQNSNSPAQFQAYLDQYPNGTFAPLARARIEELKAKPADTARSGEQVASLTEPDATILAAEEAERSIGLTKQGRSRAQLALTLLGYKTGGTDGSFGPKSRNAIKAWQADRGEAVTGYFTPQQHAALLDAAAPKLAAWDAEQKRKAAEAQARQEQQAAEAAKQQQYQQQQSTTYGTSSTTTRSSTQDAAAQAEAERLRLENEQLKKQAEAQEDRENAEIGIGIFNSVIGGASLFK